MCACVPATGTGSCTFSVLGESLQPKKVANELLEYKLRESKSNCAGELNLRLAAECKSRVAKATSSKLANELADQTETARQATEIAENERNLRTRTQSLYTDALEEATALMTYMFPESWQYSGRLCMRQRRQCRSQKKREKEKERNGYE